MDWKLLFALPNLDLTSPFESEFLSIVPYKDDRITEILSAGLASSILLKGFKTQYGNNVNTCALIRRVDHPKSLNNYDYILSFRNIFAICSLVRAWIGFSTNNTMSSPAYSDYFNFYPMEPSADDESFITATGALASYGMPKEFNGQTSPYIGNSLFPPLPDKDLVKPLLQRWENMINEETNIKSNRNLFRSMEIAYMAMSVPGTQRPTILEYGARIALWISAFEVLFHPKGKNKVSFSIVASALGKYPLDASRLKRKSFKLRREINSKKKGNLCQALLDKLYDSRNDFLHGNPFGENQIIAKVRNNKTSLIAVAPLLYRIALAVFLNLVYPKSSSLNFNSKKFISFLLWEGYERALLQIIDPDTTDI